MKNAFQHNKHDRFSCVHACVSRELIAEFHGFSSATGTKFCVCVCVCITNGICISDWRLWHLMFAVNCKELLGSFHAVSDSHV